MRRRRAGQHFIEIVEMHTTSGADQPGPWCPQEGVQKEWRREAQCFSLLLTRGPLGLRVEPDPLVARPSLLPRLHTWPLKSVHCWTPELVAKLVELGIIHCKARERRDASRGSHTYHSAHLDNTQSPPSIYLDRVSALTH
ncbi:hypothetical protein NDU88_004015 [Pleurodeles waltl]|uniref:Uncharacterized protein n=1 Tax=Pleurodeles waltl TaxID=8319 RepID=A0AAV7V2D4_PLEWA|nr:hypothetical protein NDU88_004015 [Pleurodeles waltl]